MGGRGSLVAASAIAAVNTAGSRAFSSLRMISVSVDRSAATSGARSSRPFSSSGIFSGPCCYDRVRRVRHGPQHGEGGCRHPQAYDRGPRATRPASHGHRRQAGDVGVQFSADNPGRCPDFTKGDQVGDSQFVEVGAADREATTRLGYSEELKSLLMLLGMYVVNSGFGGRELGRLHMRRDSSTTG